MSGTKMGNRAAKKRAAKLNQQQKVANKTAKYGVRGKPAPVTIKKLDGTVIRVTDQSRLGAQTAAQAAAFRRAAAINAQTRKLGTR